MGWHYKPPQVFPATFLDALRQAVLQPGEKVLLASFPNRRATQAVAEHFRYFRWCIRKVPDAHHEMFTLLESHEVRTQMENDPIAGFHLWLTAKPTKLSEFERLNPELSAMVLRDCQ